MLNLNRAIGLSLFVSFFSLTSPRMAIAQEIGFSERYALAENREAALAELIPGTDTYYYYHCLYCQTDGKIAEARGHLDAWIAKFGLNDQTQRMRTRQFILEYKSNAQATLNFLRTEFGINTDHPAPRKDEAAELETKLDPKVIDWQTLLSSHANNLGTIENTALAFAVPFLNEQTNLRSWLERIDRSDMPGLVEIVQRELKMPDSRGFGWAPIHNQMTNAQLLELQKGIPTLLESNAFVQARLRRIRPNDDQSIDNPAVLLDHLKALEEFTTTLPESQNSLKASVLFHRLQLDERSGSMDRNRFLRYLELPSNRPYCNPEYAAKQAHRPQINLGVSYQAETMLAVIGDDTSLVRRYLEHFLQSDATVDAFSQVLDRDFLRRVFASTKILYGIGDAKTYYAQLSPDEQREVQSRIELNFAPTNPVLYRPSDAVRLTLDVKNVTELLVKIYRINARNVLMQQKQPIGTNIDLDGLVANLEKRISYSQPADRRHREVLEMPELSGGGVWVVDVLAGGLRSRTLIHKGHLHAIQRRSNAGDVFRVFDGDGQHVPTAKAIFGTREFATEADGNIIIPFGKAVQSDSLILFDGPIASVQPFVHYSETYALQSGFLIDPQSLLAGAQATVVIRPNLMCNGQFVSLAQLEKPKLTVTSTDLDGIAATQTFSDIQLADSSELVKTFLVPQRLASIVATLSGEVLMLSNDTRVQVSASHSIAVNESARTALIRDFYLTQTDQGYLLEVRGRNGEPATRLPVQLEFKLYGLGATTSIRLATDEKGVVDLGPLANIERFKATSDATNVREFILSNAAPTWPSVFHALQGETIELAMSSADGIEPVVIAAQPTAKTPGRYGLVEYRGGIVFASHSDKVTIEQGLLKIVGLDVGSYRLLDHASGRTVQISVVKGVEQADTLVGQEKILESNRVRPVFVQDVKIEADKIRVQVGNHDRFTRVHVVANAFRPITGHGLSLPAPALSLSSASRLRIPSFYINSLKLDEEYQYVLQRQFAAKYLGSLLPQPSAILNPWELSVTQNTSKDAAVGDPMAAMAAPPAAMGVERGVTNGAAGMMALNGLPDYEFLKRGCMMLTNGKCDDAGLISIDRKALNGLTSVTVLVVHPSGTTFRSIALPLEQPRELNDRRLANAFAATDRLTEVQGVKILTGTEKHDLGDASSTRVKLYNSIADVFALYKTFLPNQPDLVKFECLTKWSTLRDEEKDVHYADLACHELNLFLMLHDKPYFDRVVRPYLANKMQKQFMDDYVLGLDLAKYVRPWKLAQLNAVERVLLAKKLDGQSGSTKRWMGDLVRSAPIDSNAQANRFATALMSTSLGISDDARLALGETTFFLDAKSRGSDANRREDQTLSLNRSFGGEQLQRDKSDRFYEAEMLMEQVEDSPKKEKQAQAGRAYSNMRRAGGLGGGRGLGRLYQSLESTRKWAESNFFHLTIQNQNAAVVRPNQFWLDYLNHSGDSAFLSESIDMAASNIHEAILALAVLGLPIQSEPIEMGVENGRIVVSKVKNAIAFVQGIRSVEASNEPATVLASQNIFLATDPIETAKPVQDKSLIKGTVYRLRLVLTNPSATQVRMSVLQQIPQGAIPLENAKTVAGRKIDLAPFATQELTTKFYFPAAGSFQHYGAQIAIDGKSVIAAPSTTLKVLDVPDSVDESSWAYVSAWGSDDQILKHLETANLFKIDLDSIAWRMSNRKFFDACLTRLTDYGIFNATLWAYALKHNDALRLREYLERSDAVVARVGIILNADIMQVEPIDRLAFEHLDFRPLVVARTHQLGAKRVILNDGLAIQYEQLMGYLSHQMEIEAEQRLCLVYYMLLQNRVEEAIAHFAKTDLASLESKLQHDYFAAYLDMLQGKFDEADLRSQKYVQYPNPRWRDWFGQVRSHVSERKALQAGKTADIASREDWKTDASNRILSGGREQQNVNESAVLPVLDLIQDGEKVVMRYRNLAEVEINFYLMDVELLFSRSPFSQQDGGRLNSIEPNLAEKRKLVSAKSTADVSIDIPDKLKNLVIEVIGGGLVRNLVLYANSLVVNVSPNMGRLQVLTKRGLQPLEGAYVKVYARDQGGAAKFYKDGYTDLRGQFDYTSLSTNELESTQRFSLLILHPEHGTIVRETEPPKR